MYFSEKPSKIRKLGGNYRENPRRDSEKFTPLSTLTLKSPLLCVQFSLSVQECPIALTSRPSTRYHGVTLTLASTKTMRRALECKDYNKGVARFMGPTTQALRVAWTLDWAGTSPWRTMWVAGWAAAWPPSVRGYWWTLASGTRYFAAMRRAYDYEHAGRVLCATDGGTFTPMDTILHLTQCPSYSALWSGASAVLAVGGQDILPAHVLRFAIYGHGDARAADVTTLVRGSIIAAIQHVRSKALAASRP